MAQSLSHDRHRSQGRSHTDAEWESVKHAFYYYYIEKNMSLKEAARKMSEIHHFDATLRQWERRIAPEKWNLPKYANREERLKQIEKSGKSLLEVSHRGRRKSIASDGRPGLTEDRNLRRFARREVSRDSRPRAKSVSELSDASDQEMTGTSTAPSPSASDMYTESQGNTPFPMTNFDDMHNNWMSAGPSSQGSNLAPRIEFSNHDGLDLPAITLSVHDDPSYLSHAVIPLEKQSQSSEDYSQTQGEDPLPAFIPQSQHISPSRHPVPGGFGSSWTNPDSFMDHTVNSQSGFPDFGLENFTSEGNLSYTQMLSDVSDVPQGSSSHVTIDSHLDSFNNENFDLQNDPATSSIPADAMPDFDNTHADVHALMQDHYDKTLQMVRSCLQGCQKIPGQDASKRQAIEHLKLLEIGLRAQNDESDRNLRTTLKDISATQRRATRDIYELSSRRKRKIEELKAQTAIFNGAVDGHTTFGYG